MSTQSSTNLRPNEELEGTLLPSTQIKTNILPAQAIFPPPPPPRNPSHTIESESDKPLIIEEAVPLLPFNIEDSNADDTIKGEDDEDEPLFGIIAATSTAGRENTRIESSRIHEGTSVGQRNKFEENFEIKKGKKQAVSKQHNESEAIKVANQMAKIRLKQEREGFTKDVGSELVIDNKEKKTIEKRNNDTTGYSVYGSKGYETSSYEVSDYKSEYEYKSIYD